MDRLMDRYGEAIDSKLWEDVRQLVLSGPDYEIRALERLKARYCRTLDTKDWNGFRDLFTHDFVSDTSDSGGPVIHGADEFVSFIRKTLDRCVTVHQVQQPELDLTSATTARGVWAMHDVVRLRRGLTLHGHGHYAETYEKIDRQWRIKSSTLTRLHEQIATPIVTLYISDRVRRALQRAAQRVTTNDR
jgi:hypothetical protein